MFVVRPARRRVLQRDPARGGGRRLAGDGGAAPGLRGDGRAWWAGAQEDDVLPGGRGDGRDGLPQQEAGQGRLLGLGALQRPRLGAADGADERAGDGGRPWSADGVEVRFPLRAIRVQRVLGRAAAAGGGGRCACCLMRLINAVGVIARGLLLICLSEHGGM